MSLHYLHPLFSPRSVAVFGASDREESVAGVIYRNLAKSGFNGKVYPVNSAVGEVIGVGANVTNTSPVTWATSDEFHYVIVYEAA